jgi:hypothetical protein
MFIRTIAVTCVLAFLPVSASAQALRVERNVTLTPTGPAVTVDAPHLTDSDNPPPARQHRKDSLWNGVLIGAGLGALVGALAGSAVFDCSECSGFNVPLTFGVLGAGAGAGIGAGIDAWRQTRSTVRIAPNRNRRFMVSPVLGKDVQGMVASIRF